MNTQVLNRVLDVFLGAMHAASDLDYKLVEQEAAILLPALVEKSGHNIESVREKFRSISRHSDSVLGVEIRRLSHDGIGRDEELSNARGVLG